MKVIWDIDAKKARNQVAYYIQRKFGAKRKTRFLQEVQQTAKMLSNYPNIGVIDPLYNDSPIAYRSVIINGLSKMVYHVEDDIVYIAAFWDCRREPIHQTSKTEFNNQNTTKQ